MSKKASLAEALKKTETQEKSEIKTITEPGSESPAAFSSLPPSRRGKKPLTVYIDPAVIKQLKKIGLEIDATNQDMVAEALNDFFIKHGKSPIA